MEVKGKYKKDNQGFINVFSNNTLYTINSLGDWGCVHVGEKTFSGYVLDQETYNKWEEECSQIGTFDLE